MHSLRQQLLFLVIGPLILLSILGLIVTGLYMKDRALLATDTKVRSDLAAGEEIIALMYPGPWEVKNGILYKGGVKITNNFAPVDKIAALTGDTVTIFLGDTRVSTTVLNNGRRAIGTRVSEAVATKVLKHGQEFYGPANVVGEWYETAYKPIRDANGKIIGMLYVGISKKLYNQLIRDSQIILAAMTAGLTLLVAVGAWFFAQRKIIGPLQQITLGTREMAKGHLAEKVEVTSSKEIGELARAYNQMLEGMQRFALHISKAAGSNESAEIPVAGVKKMFSPVVEAETAAGREEELPKGLNESTLKQILNFLGNKDTGMSAEEIGEGVNLTRVTARRYLEYLEKTGRVDFELKYGTVGRPVKLYRKS